MDYVNIEEIVRENVPFTHGASSKGWNSTYCEVCGDGTHSKGQRGGWLFTDDIVFYNCFNCGIDGNFDPCREYPYSQNMYSIFKAFNIPLKDCYALIKLHGTEVKREVKHRKIEFDDIDLPDHFYPLSEASDENIIARAAVDHLIHKRRIDPDSFPFYLSTGETRSTNPVDIRTANIFTNRLIMPAYVNDKLIGYEGMALGTQTSKYIGIGSNLIHGYNNIFGKDDDVPLFVMEGFFDAYHFNGVATMTNKLTSTQIELLNRTHRPKIIIPDKGNSHNALAEKGLDIGWGISLPDIAPYKDVSEAIEHYGSLYVIKSAMENIKYGNIAKISLRLYNIR